MSASGLSREIFMALEKRTVRNITKIAFWLGLLLPILPTAFGVFMGYGGLPSTLKDWGLVALYYSVFAGVVFLVAGFILSWIYSGVSSSKTRSTTKNNQDDKQDTKKRSRPLTIVVVIVIGFTIGFIIMSILEGDWQEGFGGGLAIVAEIAFLYVISQHPHLKKSKQENRSNDHALSEQEIQEYYALMEQEEKETGQVYGCNHCFARKRKEGPCPKCGKTSP
jgi:hypothetical protein